MLIKADYKWLAGFSLALALLILLFRLPILSDLRQPLEYSDLEGYLRHTTVRPAPAREGLHSDALLIARYGDALQRKLGVPAFKILTLALAMASGAALIALFYVALTAFSSNVIARSGSLLFLLQGYLIANLASNLTLTLGLLGLLGTIYCLGSLKAAQAAVFDPAAALRYTAFILLSLGLYYQIPLTLFVLYPTLLWVLLQRRAELPRSRQLLALLGVTAGVPALFALLMAARLGGRSLFYPLPFAELGFYNGFSDPLRGNWGKGLHEWGADCVRFWLNVLVGFLPTGGRDPLAALGTNSLGYFATVPFLAIFAARGLSVRVSQSERNYLPVFAGVALIVLALPFIITLLPREMQSAGFLPVVLLLLFFCVMGVEQFSGAFGALAQRIFHSVCLALAIVSVSTLWLEWGYAWWGVRESRLHYSTLTQAAQNKLEKEDSFAATLFSPAFLDVGRPALILRGISVRTDRPRKLTGPGEWFEYFEALHFSARPRLMIFRKADWPRLDLFREFVYEWPDQPDNPLLLTIPDWNVLDSGKRPEKDPAMFVGEERQPVPDWALALTLVDTVDIGDRFSEGRHAYRCDAGLAEHFANQTLLNRMYHRSSYPVLIWDGGRIARRQEQFELNAPYGANPGLLIFRTDSATTCTMRIAIGAFQTQRTLPPGFEQLWQEGHITIPQGALGALQTRTIDGQPLQVAPVRIDYDFGGSFAAYNSYHYWYYQSRTAEQSAVNSEQ